MDKIWIFFKEYPPLHLQYRQKSAGPLGCLSFLSLTQIYDYTGVSINLSTLLIYSIITLKYFKDIEDS